MHDDAASAEETDWAQILAWYDDLVELTDDPVRRDPAAVLGRAVAVGHVHGAPAGLRETDALREVIGDRHRWHAVRGYLHELDGDLPAAAAARTRATDLSGPRPQKSLRKGEGAVVASERRDDDRCGRHPPAEAPRSVGSQARRSSTAFPTSTSRH